MSPEPTSPAAPAPLPPLAVGFTETYGPLRLSREEIIRFAREMDPQAIHIDEAAARASRFGDIIASGLHAYVRFHVAHWVPLVRAHFICGMSIDTCQFYKPLYPDQPIQGRITLSEALPNPPKGVAVLKWHWEFLDGAGELLNEVRFTSLHQLSAIV